MTTDRKNDVFAYAEKQGIQAVSNAERAKAEFGLDVPIETVPIPSRGLCYPQASSLYGRETVDIRSMTAREEDILTSKAYLKKGTVITELIRSCLMDKSIDVLDMLAGDRNALMIAIRITGYGHEYESSVECSAPDCKATSTQTFDLSRLPIKPLAIEPASPGENVFSYQLPRSKKNVKFKFLTGKDEEDMNATAEKMKKLGIQDDSAVTTNLMYSITEIDGITDKAKISLFVKNMPAQDSRSLREFIRVNEPGVDMKQTVVCPQCGNEEEVTIPFDVTFLWPDFKR